LRTLAPTSDAIWRGEAPRTTRTPISRVRSTTRCEMTAYNPDKASSAAANVTVRARRPEVGPNNGRSVPYSHGMRNDLYLRVVLTVIAGALIHLCIIFTPLPAASAQGRRVVGAPTPGESTGPAEMVIVGFRVPPDEALPIQGKVSVAGDVTVGNTVRVAGRVQTEPVDNTATRTVLVGWEDSGQPHAPGRYAMWSERAKQALPVSPR
jgi:hypothetical protein